ncbi:hypothetical protein MNBD_ALPHA06-264 [hydrothermal vent metagenome]|uniref:SMP-30/Gluconolactonase/LRE-like region domain-containing protein n=1 Tax=hydrothermal vent metagenome TaxID=652676 RepID=A0A3B0RUY5_9ZZZZ
MGKILHRGGLILLFLLVAGSVFWWRTMLWTGQLRSAAPHFEGSCQNIALAGTGGSEDLVIDRNNRLVYISRYDFRSTTADGSIWLMPVDAPNTAKQMKLPLLDGARFAPHGIDLWVDSAGRQFLFVIDHGSAPTQMVRKFEIVGDSLRLVRSFQSPEFYSPNDVAVIGENQFYLTNDNRAKPGSMRALFSVLLRQKTGNVVWTDGEQSNVVASGMALANGIAVSNDRETLYVSSTIDQKLRIFSREQNNGALQLTDSLPLDSGLDNIDVAADGSVWIGSHPRLLDFSAHAADSNKRSPSQVLRLDMGKKSIEEIYASDGNPLSGVSVAAQIDNRLFLGAVFDPTVLVCTVNEKEKS